MEEKKYETSANIVISDATDYLGVPPDVCYDDLISILIRILKIRDIVDKKLDVEKKDPEDVINEVLPIIRDIFESQEIILKEQKLSKLRELIKLESAVIKERENKELTKKKAEEYITQIIPLKSADYEFCYDIVIKYSKLKEMQKQTALKFLSLRNQVYELDDELDDYDIDEQNKSYNSIIIAKQYEIPAEFFKKYVYNILNEMDNIIKKLKWRIFKRKWKSILKKNFSEIREDALRLIENIEKRLKTLEKV